ncbi:hypothetical protein [Aerolutibacter ruishenii]|uniref:Glycosyltransferase RgtA/B/C/D-like domain-containing protein n=1 Tax=Aerolutibacter ruishenii TaxID=686800 RepID=A0A562M2J3_9GAMM|nr:hypothetical protein [Lysobacter ruishenii]TWI14167.1 hypothetical protein IP93_00160 [Lysobacter ruishenii]
MLTVMDPKDPGIARGLFFAKAKPVAISAIIAFTITLVWLKSGFSAFDDGAYAWAMEELFSGKVLHRDVPWPHPGYVLWILLPFERFLEQDIANYRAPLPWLAAFTSACVTTLFRNPSASTGALCGITISALGFVQFATYSASWFAVACMAGSVAAAHNSRSTSGASRTILIVTAGSFAGLAFGFRGPNGVAALVASCMIIAQVEANSSLRPASALDVGLGMCFALAGLVIFALAGDIEKIYLATPAVLACGLATAAALRGKLKTQIITLVQLALGFLLSISPIIAWAIVNNATREILTDIYEIPLRISKGVDPYHPNGIKDLISQFLEIIDGNLSGITSMNLIVFLLFVASPAITVLALRRTNQSPHPSSMWILAAFSAVGILSLPRLLYACYVIPFTALTIYQCFEQRKRSGITLLLLCGVFLFISPRGLFPGSFGWMTNKSGIEVATCPVDRCSVKLDARAASFFKTDIEVLRNAYTPDTPYVILHTSAPYVYFLDNPTPFTLNRYDYLGSYEETASFRSEFLSNPKLIVAVPRDEADKHQALLTDYNLDKTEGRWLFYKRAAVQLRTNSP